MELCLSRQQPQLVEFHSSRLYARQITSAPHVQRHQTSVCPRRSEPALKSATRRPNCSPPNCLRALMAHSGYSSSFMQRLVQYAPASTCLVPHLGHVLGPALLELTTVTASLYPYRFNFAYNSLGDFAMTHQPSVHRESVVAFKPVASLR